MPGYYLSVAPSVPRRKKKTKKKRNAWKEAQKRTTCLWRTGQESKGLVAHVDTFSTIAREIKARATTAKTFIFPSKMLLLKFFQFECLGFCPLAH